MVRPEGMTPGAGDSYRLESASAPFVWASLAIVAFVSHVLGLAILGVAALPLVLVFVRLNPYRFLVLWIASYLLFFETSKIASNFLFLSVPDVLLLVYAVLLALFALPENLRFRLPISSALIALYLLIALTLALTPAAIASYPKVNVLFDLKVMACMAFIPLLLQLEGPEREPKKVFLLMGTVVIFSALHSIALIALFLLDGLRPVTWTGIFMGTSIFFCAEMLRLPLARKTRLLLWAGMATCALGLVITQTRGLWLAAMVCFVYFLGGTVVHAGRRWFRVLLRFVLIACAIVLVVNFAFQLAAGKSLIDFMLDRLAHFSPMEIADPYSSTGYRIHESWAVWDERTPFGHGPGATLNLFFTQKDHSDFMEWWSIHSGYFEILHKYGFAGLFLFGWMGLALFTAAGRVMRNGDAASRAGGMAVQLMLINHAVYSITSNEFNRPNSPIMWLLAFYFVTKLQREKPRALAAR